MPTLIKLRIHGNRPIEQVDLDQLTPRARAFAEAIHDCVNHQALDITWEKATPGDEAQPERGTNRNWSRLRADSGMTVVEWLEREVRTMPLDAYPVAAAWPGASLNARKRVPSAEAAATDRALTPGTVLDYMREHGRPMGVHAWDTLRGTGHLPEPDRYVCGVPQWRPETIDAYIARDVELWPISRVADYLGYGGSPASAASSARKQLHRWGFTPERRAPGRGGESLYASDQIIAAHTHRPGRGVGGGRPRSS